MTTGTVRFHRVLRAAPELVYRAFVDADALVKWLPPFGFTAKMHQFDARTGGGYRMSFTNFSAGHSHGFAAEYHELVPAARIRYTTQFDDANLPGEMDNLIALRAVSCSTEIEIVQSGIPAMIPTEMCYLGWQESLVQLARLVEPVTPG